MKEAEYGWSEIVAASLTVDLKGLSPHGPCPQCGELFHKVRSESTVTLSLAPLKGYSTIE